MEYPTVSVQEGSATILVPRVTASRGETLERARSRAPVFYNPTMKTNRDSAVLSLGVLARKLGRDLDVCEPMCGTGIRGIRLALEVGGIGEVVMGDMSLNAVRLSQENVKRNGVSEVVRVRNIEANLLLSLHASPLSRMDYIDIDPYGTPSPFLDSAARACTRDGMVALTATDMAPLCGVNPRACRRKYGSTPLKVGYGKESALRILAGAFVRRAAAHEVASRPVFGFAADHYVRLYVGLGRGKKNVDAGLKEMGYLLHCHKCLHRKPVRHVPLDASCEFCGSPMMAAGPLWLGDFAETLHCETMEELSRSSYIGSNRKLMGIISRVKGEIGLPPGYYDIDKLSSRLRIPSRPLEPIIEGLLETGFRAARSHVDDRGLKTDAPIGVIKGLVTGSAGRG